MVEKPTYEELEKRIHKFERAELAQKQVKEDWKLTQFTVDNSTDAVYWIGPDAQFIYANNAAVAALGYSKGELLTMTVHDICPEFPADLWTAHWVKLNKKKTFDIQTIHQRKDGSIFPVEITVNFIQFGSREINYAVARDITERKQVETALLDLTELNQKIISESPIGISIYDEKGQCVAANDACGKIIGTTREQVLSQNYNSIKSWQKIGLLDIARKAIQKQTTQYFISPVTTTFGKQLYIECYLVPLVKKDGDHLMFLINDITERKQIEKKLTQSEMRYRTLTELLPLAIFEINSDGNIIFANNSALQSSGYNQKDLKKNLNISQMISHEDHDRAIEMSQKVMRGETTDGSEYLIKRKDGSTYPGFINTIPLKNTTQGLSGYIFDLTPQKKAENSLKASKEKFIKLFQTNPATITISRIKDGLYLDVNDAFTKIFGWKREEVIGRTSLEIGIWGDNKNRQELVELISKEKSVRDYEITAQTKQGKPITLSVSLDQIEMDGEMCFLSTAINISKRKTAELALQESEEKYRSMMESMEESAYICSTDFQIRYMNPAMIRRIGYNAIGETCYKAIYGFDKKCSWCIFEKIIKGESINYEIVNPKDDRIYNISNSPIFHTDGSVSKLTVFHDITHFKVMEDQLNQAQKMESIGTLAGGIAHDFNNILFPIVGHSEMLINDLPEESPFQENLQEIHTASLRAKKLVKQILTFSRQKNIDLNIIKIQPIIKEALKLIRATIPATINIKQDINNDCGIIKADPIQIHQIIMNLSTNAYHAMEETGGELKIRLKKVKLNKSDVIISDMAPGVYNCLTVSDTGTGMDKKLVEQIFDPFFTTKKPGKGTGMGLSVVHGIIKNMKGFIKVYSQPGKGTKFHIYLPFVDNFSKTQKIHQMKKPIQGGIERILHVDDENSVALIVKQMLERLGYQVTSYISSIEALKAFRAAPDKFDLVISDYAMPDIPGDKLAAELNKIRPDIAILLCTGFSEAMTESKAASLGINGFLLKPVVMQELSDKIREVLN